MLSTQFFKNQFISSLETRKQTQAPLTGSPLCDAPIWADLNHGCTCVCPVCSGRPQEDPAFTCGSQLYYNPPPPGPYIFSYTVT